MAKRRNNAKFPPKLKKAVLSWELVDEIRLMYEDYKTNVLNINKEREQWSAPVRPTDNYDYAVELAILCTFRRYLQHAANDDPKSPKPENYKCSDFQCSNCALNQGNWVEHPPGYGWDPIKLGHSFIVDEPAPYSCASTEERHLNMMIRSLFAKLGAAVGDSPKASKLWFLLSDIADGTIENIDDRNK